MLLQTVFIASIFVLALGAPQSNPEESAAPVAAGNSNEPEGVVVANSSATQTGVAGSEHQLDLMEDDVNPALARSRRDALCHDGVNGKQHCTSIQCDPKYGWCAHCSFDLPADESEAEKLANPPMNCYWVRIVTGGTASSMVPSIAIMLAIIFSPFIVINIL